MRPGALTFSAAVLLLAGAFASCGKNDPGVKADSGVMMDGRSSDTPGMGGAAACLDTPGDLARPPSGSLPCDLIPPGLPR